VCPTGIDIRQGLQYECIACAACIDACDGVMDKMQAPRGLIRYATQHSIEGKPTKLLRPRIAIYAVLLASLSGAFVAALFMRTPLELDLMRDRNALYRESRPGFIENVYTLRVINKDDAPHVFDLAVSGLPTVQLEVDGPSIEVAASDIRTIAARVLVEDGSTTSGGHDVVFTLTAADDAALTTAETGRFFSP
jgi:cytochrome c oxidase accessory protein FixG